MEKSPVLPVLFCLVPIATSWMFDMPQVLAIPLKNHNNVGHDQTLLMYSFYALPNLILVFFYGTILNRWGSNVFLAGILTALFGNMFFWSATYLNVYKFMLLGRFLIGIGVEGCIAASYYT